ncbi:hypothetical protein L596_020980 [Steinernema carpocapsae]|uniref:Acyltransferase 3 domain-containing protein n=1 Tax=Steinernema carpocapsae TaxID=34508 RepID=A0A4U5MV51_STECR|nr:hypothetical protein L596_020980 [Steinernema carpocapsae]
MRTLPIIELLNNDSFQDAVHSHLIFGPLFGNSSLGVEIFLVLSGLLAARSWIHAESERQGKSFPRQLVSFLVKRVFRLFPSVAFFIWLAQSPLTKIYLPRFWNTMVSSCGWKGIASHLTFTNNWQSAPTCLGYLWYLGLDMQMYAVAPILLFALAAKPKLGAQVLVALIVISSGLRAIWCRRYNICNQSDVDIPFISYPNQTDANLTAIYKGLWDIYSRPCTKSGPFFIGLLTGFVSTSVKLSIPAPLRKVLNMASILGCLFGIFGILPEYWYPDAGNTLYNTIYTAIFRSLFAACISWQILYLVNWRSLPDSKIVSIMAKLTFQAYLLHMPMVYLFNHSRYLQSAEGPCATECAVRQKKGNLCSGFRQRVKRIILSADALNVKNSLHLTFSRRIPKNESLRQVRYDVPIALFSNSCTGKRLNY